MFRRPGAMLTRAALGLALAMACLAGPWASAAEVLVTARVEGSKYVNTTPQAAFCNRFGPGYCNVRWTVDLPGSFSKSVDLASTNARDRVYAHLPPKRQLTLRNLSNGETATMNMTFSSISQKVTYLSGVTMLIDVTGGCSRASSPIDGGGWTQYLWIVSSPTNPAPCSSMATGNGRIEEVVISDNGVAFEPQFPEVATLSPGTWEGTVDYPLLAGEGFDFGTLREGGDTITFRYRFTVMHDIRVDLPAANTEVALNPPGGWQSYLMTNRLPERLYHNAPLRLWASGTFAVYLTCQYVSNARCAMKHPRLDEYVPVTTALTLPGTFSMGPQAVERARLYVGAANATLITPPAQASSQPGTLHFDVDGSNLAAMIRYRGEKYQGNIILIFDANP
ncbi:hypothetical protein [Pseudomonas eucalypticola]|uniref:Uncharacterized protein n=1 Tax=Pseudomonas eucalypticola TaxID=2599595 RepID=A0A7D5HBH2_9PSED|nr:hypothetical protein [Pseudomonas eucalypticola]QKZ03190.1 hypothetical protein HWQ56_05075 [Pseudomonas eucalypticola]